MDEQVVSTNTETPISPPSIEVPPIGETAEQKYNRLYATPPVSTPADPVATALSQMQSELAQMRSQMQAPTPTGTPTPIARNDWAEKVREGKFDEALDSMAQYTMGKLEPKFAEIRQAAYNDALGATQVNVEVDRYLQGVRAANPDILPFERYLQGPVTERISIARDAGRIRNQTDFLREYKAAVDSEVSNLRNLSQVLRGQGKDEALTRSSEVLRSSTLAPQQVQSNQSPPSGSEPQQGGESTDAYFLRRRADESRRRGLS